MFADAKSNRSTLEAHMFSVQAESWFTDSTKMNFIASINDFSKPITISMWQLRPDCRTGSSHS